MSINASQKTCRQLVLVRSDRLTSANMMSKMDARTLATTSATAVYSTSCCIKTPDRCFKRRAGGLQIPVASCRWRGSCMTLEDRELEDRVRRAVPDRCSLLDLRVQTYPAGWIKLPELEDRGSFGTLEDRERRAVPDSCCLRDLSEGCSAAVPTGWIKLPELEDPRGTPSGDFSAVGRLAYATAT